MRIRVQRPKVAKAESVSRRHFITLQQRDAARRAELLAAVKRGEKTLEEIKPELDRLIPESMIDDAGRHSFWKDELELRQRALDEQRVIARFLAGQAAAAPA